MDSSSTKQQSSKNSSILSRLAQRFPLVFKLLWKPQEPYMEAEKSDMPEDASPSNVRQSSDSEVDVTKIASEGIDKDFYHGTEPENCQTTSNGSDLVSSRYNSFILSLFSFQISSFTCRWYLINLLNFGETVILNNLRLDY